jgi:tRNA (Thr-GGU) A37 N-methylase
VREIDPASREGYGAASARRVKIGQIEAFDGNPVVDIKSASTHFRKTRRMRDVARP